jgi:hypothetical protein
MSAGLWNTSSASESVWSEPMTVASPPLRSLTSVAFAVASTSATSSGVTPLSLSGASTARSSISGGMQTKSIPALVSRARRNGLCEARTMFAPMDDPNLCGEIGWWI